MSERRPVKGFEGYYEASDDGEFFRVASGCGTRVGRKLNVFVNKYGYGLVYFCKNNVAKTILAHRATLDAFDDNLLNLPQINHKNGIKLDNRLENLERCDNSYNHKHAYRELGRVNPRKGKPRAKGAGRPPQPVRGTNIKTGEMREFESISEAAKQVGGNYRHIGSTCQDKRKSAYGYRWEYIN